MPSTAFKTLYVCQACGTQSPKWLGRCPGCAEWNTLVEESARPALLHRPNRTGACPYGAVEGQRVERISTRNAEFDRVLGGGLVPGSLVLLGGEPGIGKSTLLLQIAEGLSGQALKVLYVAGEESPEQIRMRGDRLGVEGKDLFLLAETSLEHVFDEAGRLGPAILMVDSIQTVFTEKLEAIPGSVGQVRECAAQLLTFAKGQNVSVFVIGHITKEGSLAGPKALEHIVDTVLYFEGERHQNHKIVRAVKNRFGPAHELGIFQMSGRGLLCVENPSLLFLTERRENVSGSAILGAVEGSRPVLVELQALVSQTNYSTAKRMANGVDPNRVSLLLAMLEKRVGLHLLGSDVYLNVAGGLFLSEPATDLAVVAAIVSSFYNRPLCPHTLFFGEVGLGGEVRAVNATQSRLREARNLGFRRVVLPQANLPPAEPVPDVRLEGVASVQELLERLGF